MGDNWKDVLGFIKKRMERRKEQMPSSAGMPKSSFRPSPPVNKEIRDTRVARVAPSSLREPHAAAPAIKRPETPSAPLPSIRKTDRGTIPINIGLDYGTSISKVCIRQALGLAENIPAYPIAFGESGGDLSAYLCPSAVAIQDNKLYFGWEAEKRATTDSAVLTHLKVCLACEGTKCRHSEIRCCKTVAGKAGSAIFRIRDQEITPRELVIAYIAWILSESMKRLPPGLAGLHGDHRFTCNLGVPIDWLEAHSPLTPIYRRIAYSAWHLAEGIQQGISLSTVHDWVMQADKKVLPPDHESPIQLCPETTAATISYANSANPQTGLYGLVDIGAWTTDISFFRLSDNALTINGVRNLAFYSAKTYRVAADQLDERLSDFLCEIWGSEEILSPADGNQDLVALIRHHREAGTLDDSDVLWKGSERNVPSAASTLSRILTSSALRRGFIKTLKEAYKKEPWPQEPRWRNFPIIMIGGGSEEKCFADCLEERIPITGNSMRLPFPTMPLNHPGIQVLASNSHRLAIAFGLSFPKALWPEFLPPSEVPQPPPIRGYDISPPGDNQPG